MKKVFQTDEQNVLIHELEIHPEADSSYSLPYGCIVTAPPDAAGAVALRWISEVARVDATFGAEGTGAWSALADHRRDSLYQTDTGAGYTIGETVAGQSYDGLGNLPGWLTDKPRPSGAHQWSGADWILDESVQSEATAQAERAWRDQAIEATDFMMMPDYPIDAERRAELTAYRTALRDWPESADFPDAEARPAAPAWLADELE